MKYMRYLEFREQLKEFIVFSLHDIRKMEKSFHRQRLNEWQKKGYIKKIINEYYVFSDAPLDELAVFAIANKIYQPSYISLEMALSYYGLIPEGVYLITSITSRTTRTFESEITHFSYRKIKPSLMFGYKLIPYGKHHIRMAELEKAILDYFYFNQQLRNEGEFEELRINKEIFMQVDLVKLNNYLSLFNNKALKKRITKFLNYISHA